MPRTIICDEYVVLAAVAGDLEPALALAERHEMRLGRAQAPIRVAITGRTVGPPLFESMVLLDRAEVLRRLRAARTRLAAATDEHAERPVESAE